jgi:hypothetical protein
MRRAWMLPALVGLVLLTVSCQKAPVAPTAPSAMTADAKAGFVIRSGEGLWDIQDGVAKWADSLLLGEKLALTGQTAKAVVSGGQQRDYIEVKRDSGKTGWARLDYVISNCSLAVVGSEEAILYTEPKNTAATGSGIPKLTIVAIHKEGSTPPYVKVTWFNPTTLVLSKGVYIRDDVVSQKPDDVQSVILLQLAAASTNVKQQQALLASAQKDYPGSAFITQIEDAMAALTPTAISPATEKFFATLVSTDDKVNVRDTPDATAGSVVSQLVKGQKVEVEEQTKDSFTIDDKTAPWYRIKDPAGWVFGAWLAPEE